MWDTGELQQLGAQAGDRPADRASTCRAATEGLLPTPALAQPALPRRRNRTALVGGRQRPARDRPGRPADQPAADGDRLRDDRQRRHRRHPARRACRSTTPPAACCANSTRGRRRQVKIDPEYRDAILEGLHDAAQAPGGTSYDVFGGFPVPVAGKTGTAQRAAVRRPVLVRRARSVSRIRVSSPP